MDLLRPFLAMFAGICISIYSLTEGFTIGLVLGLVLAVVAGIRFLFRLGPTPLDLD